MTLEKFERIFVEASSKIAFIEESEVALGHEIWFYGHYVLFYLESIFWVQSISANINTFSILWLKLQITSPLISTMDI